MVERGCWHGYRCGWGPLPNPILSFSRRSSLPAASGLCGEENARSRPRWRAAAEPVAVSRTPTHAVAFARCVRGVQRNIAALEPELNRLLPAICTQR